MKKISLALSISLVLGSQSVLANPNGPQVVHGSATFSSPNANTLNVTNSHNAIINWQSFNIGRGQTTNFFQPSAASSVLNRVISNNPSQLLGNLNSNGKVFLINQNGILVGADARINTGGFFASTLNITDSDFLNGRLTFEGGGLGGIDNLGYIHATDDGNIVLIAPNIENGGVISTDNGNVVLAAGESITISSLENPAMQFAVTADDNSVTNLGSVIARRGAATMFAGTLRHSGAIRAGGIVQNADGSISLVAENDITLADNSTLQAAEVTVHSRQGTTMIEGDISATNTDGTGGEIRLLGESVGIAGDALIDASGDLGGGEILVGGDVQGNNPEVPNARAVWVGSDTRISADAEQNGDGGKVIVYSKEATRSYGQITATGGQQGGDGGFIETSGGYLDLGESVPDASAVNGANGEWLIDPNNITISSAANTNISPGPDFASTDDDAVLSVASIVNALSTGNNVSVSTTTSGANTEPGNIFVNASIDAALSSDVSLTLNAHNNIILDLTGINITSTNFALDVVLNPDIGGGGDGVTTGIVNLGFAPLSHNFDTNGGTLTINGNAYFGAQGDISLVNTDWINTNFLSFGNSAFAALNLDANSSLINRGVIDFSGATINGPGSLINEAELKFTDSFSTLSSIGATLTLTNLGNIDILSGISVNTGGATLTLNAGAGLSGGGTWNGDVDLQGGYISPGDLGNYGDTTDTLTIGGDLTISSGAVISTIGDWNGDTSSTQVTSNGFLQINGGDLLTIWDSAADINNETVINSGDVITPVTCVSTGCYNLGLFDRVIDAVGLLSSTPDYTNPDTGVSLELTDIDNVANNFVFWVGPSGDWNDPASWDVGVPLDTEYAIIRNVDPETFATVTNPHSVAGLQSFGNLDIQAGGNLTINGDAFIADDDFAAAGVLRFSAADARMDGGGVLYTMPGTKTDLEQGILVKDMVNWGAVKTKAGSSFQLDSNLANFSVIFLDDLPGLNTITGSGSITNLGVLDFGDAAELALDGFITLSSVSTKASYVQFPTGSDNALIRLNGNSRFDLQETPGIYDQNIGWELNGGDVLLSGATNLIIDAAIDFLAAGGNLIIDGSLSTSGDMTIDHSTGTAGIFGSGSLTSSGNILQTSVNDFSMAPASFTSLLNIGISNGNFLVQNTAFFDGLNFAIAGGATLSVDSTGSLTTGSTFSGFNGGGSIFVDGGLLDLGIGGVDLSTLAALNVNNVGEIQNIQGASLPDNFNISGGSLIEGTGVLLIPSTTTVNINGGTFSGAGVGLTINHQGSMNIAGGQSLILEELADLQVDLNTGGLTGPGTLDIQSNGILTGTDATFDVDNLILDGGLIDADNLTYTGNFNWLSGDVIGAGSFITAGSTVVQGGVDLDTNWNIAATGTANIQGDVSFTGGSITIDSGTNLTIDGGAGLTLLAGFGLIDGAGTLLVDIGGNFNPGVGARDLSGLGVLNINGGFVANAQGTLLPATVNLGNIGSIAGNGGVLTIPAATTLTVGAGINTISNLSIDNLGTIEVLNDQLLLNNTDLTIAATGSLSGAGQLSLPTATQLATIAGSTVDIARIVLDGGTLTANTLDYAGNLFWADGLINGAGLTTSGKVDLFTLDLDNPTLDTNWVISPTGSVTWISDQATNNLAINSGGITNQGLLVINGLTATDEFELEFTNDEGTIAIQSGIFRKVDNAGAPLDLFLNQPGDTLQGFGTFDGSVFNSDGRVTPGRADPAAQIFQPGTLTITGDYTQGVDGKLFIKLDSKVQNNTPVVDNDTLKVNGTLNAGGELDFQVVNNKSPVEIALLLDQSFRPFDVGNFNGNFDTVNIPPGLNFTLGPGGVITITSDNTELNKIANELEVLFENEDLNHQQMVKAMKFYDRRIELLGEPEEEDERRRAPRLVCK